MPVLSYSEDRLSRPYDGSTHLIAWKYHEDSDPDWVLQSHWPLVKYYGDFSDLPSYKFIGDGNSYTDKGVWTKFSFMSRANEATTTYLGQGVYTERTLYVATCKKSGTYRVVVSWNIGPYTEGQTSVDSGVVLTITKNGEIVANPGAYDVEQGSTSGTWTYTFEFNEGDTINLHLVATGGVIYGTNHPTGYLANIYKEDGTSATVSYIGTGV